MQCCKLCGVSLFGTEAYIWVKDQTVCYSCASITCSAVEKEVYDADDYKDYQEWKNKKKKTSC